MHRSGYHPQMSSGSNFFLAVNYPWLTYGADFGRAPWGHSGVSLAQTSEIVAADFAKIRSTGTSVVRWFLLCDGRSGVRYEQGIPLTPDEFLFSDVAAALNLASRANLQICFSLIDFLWLQTPTSDPHGGAAGPFPGHNALQFAGGREALLEKVLIPLFREFRSHPALFAWEIVNEPEWAIPDFQRSPKATLPLTEARTFFAEIATAIHQYAGSVPATLGCARLLWLRAWSEIGLDLLQAHYYPTAESDQPLTFAQQLASLGDLAATLWLSELPSSDPSIPVYSLESSLSTCRQAGLAGAGIWRWRPPEPGAPDERFGAIQPDTLATWLSQLPA